MHKYGKKKNYKKNKKIRNAADRVINNNRRAKQGTITFESTESEDTEEVIRYDQNVQDILI